MRTPVNQNEPAALCDTCNRNQEMKVHQLRQFSPSNRKNEDQELLEYTNNLERTTLLDAYCFVVVSLLN